MHELIRLGRIVTVIFFLTLILSGTALLLKYHPSVFESKQEIPEAKTEMIKPALWHGPDLTTIPKTKEGEMIQYGHDLIEKTSEYLGPQGSVKQISNGMNCQNCHLEAGTKPYGNNFGAVASTYPRFRARSGGLESIEKRVNDCFERSLNGKKIDSLSKEMRAIVGYIQWLGKDVPKGDKPEGSGLAEIKWLDRAANPKAGRVLFLQKCLVCHGPNGAGQRLSANGRFINPPLWGENSFNTAAGLFRISSLAKFIRLNMPNGSSYENPALTEEQAWDIAAYVESMPRPDKKFKQDWPKLDTKPVDHPFGPYADKFSEEQHKYGPFTEMLSAAKK